MHLISAPEAVVSVDFLLATFAVIAFAIHSVHKWQEHAASGCPQGRTTWSHRGGSAPMSAYGPTHGGGAVLEETILASLRT